MQMSPYKQTGVNELTIKHLDVIEWPNGLGCTPCSIEYRNTLDEKRAIEAKYDDGTSVNDYSREDYERWNQLENTLAQLHGSGHIGKSVRY